MDVQQQVELPQPPAELEWLAAHLSREQLLQLIEARGGQKISVPQPQRLGPRSPLVTEIGLAAAAALAKEFGGAPLRVPMARNWQVQCLHAMGLSYTAIARRMRISDRAVYAHLHAARLTHQGGQQLRLFD